MSLHAGDAAETVFEYLYRDAGNFKSWGSLRLKGSLSPRDVSALIECMEAGEFFVAEQVGIPPLYDGLFKWSAGRTGDDHAWHSFHCLRPATPSDDSILAWGTADGLLSAFKKAKDRWTPALSPNFDSLGPAIGVSRL